MTWLRLDTVTPRSDVIGDLAESLEVELMHAFGLYVACLLGLGDHRPTGDLRAVRDRSLEQWAGWTGSPGRFAAAFRARCTADGSGHDPAGTVRGWWRQRALLEKQASDREKRFSETPENPPKNPREFRQKPPGNPRETPGDSAKNPRETPEKPPGYDNGTKTERNEQQQTTEKKAVVVTDGRAREGSTAPEEIAYLVRCVVALNSGLAGNPYLAGTHREVSASEQVAKVSWEADGIPIDVAEETVQLLARNFLPTPRNRQPHSLKYFDAAVREAAELKRLGRVAPKTGPRGPGGPGRAEQRPSKPFVPLPDIAAEEGV